MLKIRVWGSSPIITRDSPNVRGFFSLYVIHSFTLCWVSWPCRLSSSCGVRVLPAVASLVAERGLWGTQAPEHRFNSLGTRAQLFWGMRGLPRSGTEPMSPTAGRFFTTEPPRKPQWFLITYQICGCIYLHKARRYNELSVYLSLPLAMSFLGT